MLDSRWDSDPTYEAWKPSSSFHSWISFLAFRSYLWGMETRCNFFSWVQWWKIPILPMRHGNLVTRFILNERKPPFRSYLWGMETVFFVQAIELIGTFRSYLWGMETYNFFFCSTIRNLFRSYLWGMETGYIVFWFFCIRYSDPTYEAWKPIFRYNLNWPCEEHSDPTYEAWKQDPVAHIRSELTTIPILPMRHGNITTQTQISSGFQHSDPTYEAWKLS